MGINVRPAQGWKAHDSFATLNVRKHKKALLLLRNQKIWFSDKFDSEKGGLTAPTSHYAAADGIDSGPSPNLSIWNKCGKVWEIAVLFSTGVMTDRTDEFP
jgi:hypothetical protein